MPINDNRLQHADTMIITCQNCQTNYDIDAAALGGGKAVSCHNCGNTWHQNPVQAPPPVAYPQTAYPQQVPFAPPPVPAPEPQAVPEPVPEPAPAPVPEPASDIEAAPAARAEAALMAEEEDAASDDAGDDFEDAFGDDAKKGGKGKIIAIAAVVFFLLLGAGLFFGRSYIIDLYPPAGDIFAMVGLSGEELGEGLEFNNIKSAREVEKGVDVMVVRGEIANVSDQERMVPMIRVVLLDGNKEVIQSAVAAPLKNRLPAGATIAFGAKLPEPSALARSLEVTFSAPEK